MDYKNEIVKMINNIENKNILKYFYLFIKEKLKNSK